MKNIFFILFLFNTFYFYSQDKYYFHVVLSDRSEILEVIEKPDGTKTLIFKNKEINSTVNRYKVYEFKVYYKYAINEVLKSTYELVCDNANLVLELKSKFPNVFSNIWDFIPIEQQSLFTPDDYNILPPHGVVSSYPSYLDVIRAKEAWNISVGNENVILGVNEGGPIRYTHEDIEGKVLNLVNFNPSNLDYPSRRHATGVAGIMAANTNNGTGLSSIGYNCRLAQGTGFSQIMEHNPKVIQMSWGSPGISTPPNPTDQNVINEITENDGVVFVASAGNGVLGNASVSFLTSNGLAVNAENFESLRHYPASYRNVISVSTVGDTNAPYTTVDSFDNWIDMHKFKTPLNAKYRGSSIFVTEPQITHQHNDSVDIVVPGYRIPHLNGDSDNIYWSGVFGTGTSYSAPIVSGAIGLLFSVNYCLKPIEVETILKLTAVDIENYPENIQYIGRLGAGRLDAFKAVEMANEMAKPFGTVLVEDRNLYRGWFYKLETAPFEIKMLNNNITQASKVKFLARDNIEIISGDYRPGTGYVDLQINPSLTTCDLPEGFVARPNANSDRQVAKVLSSQLFPNPNTGSFTISLEDKALKNVSVVVYDVLGKPVYVTDNLSDTFEINLPNLASGVYFVKLSTSNYSETLKFIKK